MKWVFVGGFGELVFQFLFFVSNFSIGSVKEIIIFGFIMRWNLISGFILQSFPDFSLKMCILANKFHELIILGYTRLNLYFASAV